MIKQLSSSANDDTAYITYTGHFVRISTLSPDFTIDWNFGLQIKWKFRSKLWTSKYCSNFFFSSCERLHPLFWIREWLLMRTPTLIGMPICYFFIDTSLCVAFSSSNLCPFKWSSQVLESALIILSSFQSFLWLVHVFLGRFALPINFLERCFNVLFLDSQIY